MKTSAFYGITREGAIQPTTGDTTIHELRRKMPPGSDENGFGNRFIYVYVYRVKDCPLGGPPLDWSKETEQLFLTVHWAK